MTIAELLTNFFSANIIVSKNDATLEAVALYAAGGRRLILLQRTYREGLAVLLDPNDGDIEAIRTGDLWTLWNSDRATGLDNLTSQFFSLDDLNS